MGASGSARTMCPQNRVRYRGMAASPSPPRARARATHRRNTDPLYRAGVFVGALEVGGDERRVAQRGMQARVPQEPSHLIESDAVSQPRGCCEVTQGMGV